MGKSTRKAIYKDKGCKKTYHKTCRSVIHQQVREIDKLNDVDGFEISNEKTIIDDYNYSDYKLDYEHKFKDDKYVEKLRRK